MDKTGSFLEAFGAHNSNCVNAFPFIAVGSIFYAYEIVG
jgi:hypothetical protein